MTTEESAPTTRTCPCEACGANVTYAPGTDSLRCPYCGHQQAIAAADREVREHAFAALASKPPVAAPPGARLFVCPGCGAHSESDTLSGQCPFCATPLVADAEAMQRVAPEAVVPFALDRQQARTALAEWTSSRWFAPGSLKKVSEAETFKGSYLPHWTYDAATVSDYRGARGDHYYVDVPYTTTENGETVTKTRRERRTAWTPVSGTVGRDFDDVLVAGTSHVAEDQLDKLTPWPLEEARPYQEEYLSGFHTVRYDIEPEDGLTAAKERMAKIIDGDCRRDIGGDEQRVSEVSTAYTDITYKLVLLPVWFLTYLHAGKSWQVMVNARTAEVIGERPYSTAKISAAIAAVIVLVAAIVLLVTQR